MTWMITASGKEFHLAGPRSLAPDGQPFCIDDIAHHLALINRFNGATFQPLSVAAHSLMVWRMAQHEGHSPVVQMAALMHDAHEAYVGDITSPVKEALDGALLSRPWHRFEGHMASQLRRHFGLLTVFASHGPTIRRMDLQALLLERHEFTRFEAGMDHEWPCLMGLDEVAAAPAMEEAMGYYQWQNLQCWRSARDTFIEVHDRLREQMSTNFCNAPEAA